jgi:single-stranded DNA-binding protein
VNNTTFIVRRGRLIKDPTTRTVGADKKELTTITVACNPFGKNKDRYETMFVDATYAGNMGARAQGLRKGDEVSFSGCLLMRTYERKDKTKGYAFEVAYPNDLIVLSSQGDAAAEATPEPSAPPAVAVEDAFPGI